MTSELDSNDSGYSVTIEHTAKDVAALITDDLETYSDDSFLTAGLAAFHASVPEIERRGIRLVITQDFVQSVSDRQEFDERAGLYTRERLSGIVAGKTMPAGDGKVDILLPLEWFIGADRQTTTERTEQRWGLEHTVAHEAVHARLDLHGQDPFFAYHRATMPEAATQFVSCAASQVEEHLAEYISNHAVPRAASTPRETLKASFESWNDGIDRKLRGLPEDDPDYFGKGMAISLISANDLWKVIAYLAAELRMVDSFKPVPEEIREFANWRKLIGPWWEGYTALLRRVPMTIEQDVPATDQIVRELGMYLQRWFYDLGFDYHDTSRGGYFRAMIWDDER